MPLELWLMPLFAILSGIASLCIDPEDEEKKYAKPLMLSLILISGVLTIFFSWRNSVESQKKEERDQQIIIALRSEVDRSNNLLDLTLTTLKETKQELLEARQGLEKGQETIINFLTFGYTPETLKQATSQAKDQSIQADNLIEKLTITEADLTRRKSILVQYYPKDSDPKIIGESIREQGFQFYGEGISNPTLLEKPTNAIRFGSNVSLEDVKVVALILTRAGIQFQSIRRFDNPNAKPDKIEVITSASYLDSPILTIEDISLMSP